MFLSYTHMHTYLHMLSLCWNEIENAKPHSELKISPLVPVKLLYEWKVF